MTKQAFPHFAVCADGTFDFNGTEAEFNRWLRESYPFFLTAFWPMARLDRYAPLGWIELDAAQWIQDAPWKAGTLAPRKSGKTHWGTIGYTLFNLNRDPTCKVIIPSKSFNFAKAITKFCRDMIEEIPFLQHLTPGPDETDRDCEFCVTGAGPNKDPSVFATGAKGQITGHRAHIILPDDIETKDNCGTCDARDDLEHRLTEYAQVLYAPEPGGDTIRRQIMYFGTFHHEDSVYLRLARNTQVAFRTWPLLIPDEANGEECLNIAPSIRDRMNSGELKAHDCPWSYRLSPQYVTEMQSEGPRAFGLQHRLLINLGRGTLYPIKLDDLIVMDVDEEVAPITVRWGRNDHNGSTAVEGISLLGISNEKLYRPFYTSPDKAPYHDTIGYVDPAGLGHDELSVGAMGHLAGMLFLKGLIGLHVRDFIDPEFNPADKKNLAIEATTGALNNALDHAVKFLRSKRCTKIYYESNIDTFDTFGSALLIAVRRHTLQPGENLSFPKGWIASVVPKHNPGRKGTRIINAIRDVTGAHRLVVDPSCLIPDAKDPEYQLQFQLSRIQESKDGQVKKTNLTHDDRADNLANLIECVMSSLKVDPIEGSKNVREDRMKKTVEWMQRLQQGFDEEDEPVGYLEHI